MEISMRLSIFTTATRPQARGDTYQLAFDCYSELADEVVVVNGDQDRHAMSSNGKFSVVDTEWPSEFRWELIGNSFQKGYEACTGDWVIHCDLDFIFHENDYARIRQACADNNDAPALTFYKYQFILPDRYTIKSRLVLAVNKAKYGDRIRFDSGGDLCQPSLDGKYISPDDVPEAKIPFFNYEKILKTKEQIAEDSGRMERAWKRHFGEYQMGSNGIDESAYEAWLKMTVGRFNAREHKQIPLSDHPKVMQDTIKGLKPKNFGYNGHGSLPTNNYVVK